MDDPVQLPTRELYRQWLQSLTLLAAGDSASMPERLALIRRVNRSGATIAGHPPLAGAGVAADAATAPPQVSTVRTDRLSDREAAAHAVVTGLLLRWLSEATGSPQSEIITRLAVTIDALLPPDVPRAA
jgi:hypothetical protein